MNKEKQLELVLRVLEARRIRATYAAVAGVVHCSPRQVGKLLGSRRPEASWVVSARDGMPTGYSEHEVHRELQLNRHIISDPSELARLIEEHSSGSAQEIPAPPVVDQTPSIVRSLRDGDQFEMLMAQIYRKVGYRVVERGGRRADGGVDLEIYKNGERKVVQCKFRKRDQVGVKVVRELYGVMHHEGADGAVFVCTGGFTPDARDFAAANSIELVDGEGVERLLRQSGVDGRRLLGKVKRVKRSGHWVGLKGVLVKVAAMMLFLVTLIVLFVSTANHVTSTIGKDNPLTRAGSVDSTRSAGNIGQVQIAAPPTEVTPTLGARVEAENPVRVRFDQWYEPPPECIATQSNPKPDLVACGNHRIRARRDFGQ